MGLPAIAFTEHADFLDGGYPDFRELDVVAYLAEVERCRTLFPGLRILSGCELGHPHRFPDRVAAVLAAGPIDRLLGSAHCVSWEGRFVDTSSAELLTPERAADVLRAYLAELLDLVESAQPFHALAHLDYPKRYWPHADLPYREEDYEEEIRAVLRATAAREAALELNTTRGAEPHRALCPGPVVLGWWAQEGGRAVTLGSDAHDPERIARGFELAGQLAEAAGFRPNQDPAGCWRR